MNPVCHDIVWLGGEMYGAFRQLLVVDLPVDLSNDKQHSRISASSRPNGWWKLCAPPETVGISGRNCGLSVSVSPKAENFEV